jgi:diacylglycerol kinase family enzyme
MFGVVAKLSDVHVVTAREILIEGVPGRPVQADGDIIATLPVRIAIDPEPVRLIHPI